MQEKCLGFVKFSVGRVSVVNLDDLVFDSAADGNSELSRFSLPDGNSELSRFSFPELSRFSFLNLILLKPTSTH
jgi:hypothetical protein